MSDPKQETAKTVEVAAQDSGLKVVAYDYVRDHVGDFAIGLLAAVLVIIATEAVKPWVKMFSAKHLWGEAATKNVLKTMPYLFGLVMSLIFDFSTHFKNLTGADMDFVSSVLVGTLITGGIAQLIYHLIQELQLIKTIQIRWYRFMGVTQEDLAGIRETSQNEALTTEQVEEDKKTRELPAASSDDPPSVEIDLEYESEVSEVSEAEIVDREEAPLPDGTPMFDDDVYTGDDEDALAPEFREDET